MPEKWKQGYLEKLHTADGWCWFLRYTTEDGKRPRTRIGLVSDLPTKASAQKAARHVRDSINKPQGAESKRFGDVISRYLLEEIPARYSTQRNYRRMLRMYIEPKWAASPLLQVKAASARTWLLELDLAPRTRSHIHGLMKSLFRFAMLWEWYPLGENPMALFFVPGGSKREKEPQVLTPDQFAKLIEAIPGEPYRTMVIASMCLGLRCSELVGLRWGDLDFLREEVTIRRAVVEGRMGDTKTPPSKAKLPLDPQLAAVFASYRAVAIRKGQGDWLFGAPKTAGEKPLLPNNVQHNVLRPAGRAIGLDFSLGWHTLRHTYKSWMDRVGAGSAVKRDLMRHADIRTTENVYGRVHMDQMREVNAKVVNLARIQ